MKGRIIFKPWGMDCVCVPFRGWMGKTKYLSAFERGSRCQALQFECVKTCNAVGFFILNSFLCVSRAVHHPKDIQPTWHNCGKHWSQHGVLFWGEVQLNIRKGFLMFGILSVYQGHSDWQLGRLKFLLVYTGALLLRELSIFVSHSEYMMPTVFESVLLNEYPIVECWY